LVSSEAQQGETCPRKESVASSDGDDEKITLLSVFGLKYFVFTPQLKVLLERRTIQYSNCARPQLSYHDFSFYRRGEGGAKGAFKKSL
jgi:hypothetical protein